MDPLGIRLVADPHLSVVVLASVACGAGLGALSGLVPGLHANNFALLLASVAPAVPAPTLAVGTAMLAAGVVHTFLNVVPALALGVPEAETAVTTLPGHRLVLDGRGREAIRLSALGSGLAIVLAVPLAIPITRAMTASYPTIRPNMPLVFVAVVVAMVVAEPTRRARAGAALGFLLSAGLGAAALDLDPAAPLDAGGMLAPLFAGLFGAPILLEAMAGGGVPRQADAAIRSGRGRVALTAGAGALAGAIVGYLPGISAAIAAVAVLACLPRGVDDRGYIVATSGVNTANTVFALFALVAIGQPRTGVMVAFESSGAPLELPVLVSAVTLAGAVGFLLVVSIGDWYLGVVGRLDHRRLSLGVLGLLIGLSGLLAGPLGVGAFVLATAIGLVPPHLGARRVHLMGVLIGPLLVSG